VVKSEQRPLVCHIQEENCHSNNILVEAEVKKVWSYTSIIPKVFMIWCLVRARDCFAYLLSVEINQY
jgi:hypothetical protein